MSTPASPRALYLQTADATVFAFLHPGAGTGRETAVLLCPPFGWEDMCSYRVRREWAEHLARAGFATLRMDLPGSGDSAGVPTDPAQLDTWTEAVDGAARWLRSAAGATRLAVLGIGLGGIVSCRAALLGAPIDELVLWPACARGRVFVRELRAFAALEVANTVARAEGASPGEPDQEGTLVANGYLLSAETVAQLERLDLREVEPSTTLGRALLLGRDGLKVDQALGETLERAGAAVTVADGRGYGEMMQEAQDARAPVAVFELVSSWLEDGGRQAVRGSRVAMARTPERARASAPPVSEPTALGELVLRCCGNTLRETPLFLDGPNGRLFGVLSEPLGARRQLSALLLNAGPQRRTGPNRMWVEIARRWAARGVATLRLDADGIGDADGDASVLGRVTAFYRPEYVEQARAALDALAGRGLPPRFIALGLCSGAYWAAQAALADERVAGVAMLNPRTLVFDEWRHTVRRTRHLRERALMASTWRRLLRGEIKLSKHLETGRTIVARAASAPLRVRGLIDAPHQPWPTRADAAREPIEVLFDALGDRDQRALLLFTGSEVLRGEMTEKGVLAHIEDWPNLELALLGTSADTHTLTPLWLQRQVHALLDRMLEDELERLGD